jgi:hypothetical protein
MKTTEKPKSKKQQKIEEQQAATERLLQLFEGDESPEILTIVRHVSRSGMSRNISLKYVKNGELLDITYSAALVLDWPLVEGFSRAIKVGGCGMDMGFHTVYSLSGRLYGYQERNAYRLRHRWA